MQFPTKNERQNLKVLEVMQTIGKGLKLCLRETAYKAKLQFYTKCRNIHTGTGCPKKNCDPRS